MISSTLSSAAPGQDRGGVRTTEDVVQLVQTWIESAKLREGDRLPTERALAEQFALNRNLVRRAFLQLDRMGLINRHVGRGTFVGSAPARAPGAASLRSAPVPALPLDCSPAALLQARLLLEPRIATLAVANATQADLAALDQIVGDAEAATTPEAFEGLGQRFVEVLSAITRNPLIQAMVGLILGARRALGWQRGTGLGEDERAQIVAGYRAVVDAIRSRDPDAASATVSRMLLRDTRTFSLLARMELLPDDI